MSWLDSFFGNTFQISYLGVLLPKRPTLDFEGAGVVVADDSANNRTVATVAGIAGGSTPPPIRFAFGFGSTTYTSATSIPAGYRVWRVEVVVTTPFSAGFTLALGQTGSTTLLFTTGTVDAALGIVGTTPVDLDVPWGGSSLPVLATVGGTHTAGAGSILVFYGPVTS